MSTRIGALFLGILLSGLLPVRGGAQIITTLTGADWLFQDNGKPGVNAALGNTTGVVTDSAGNVYVADRFNNQVFKIAPNGILTVVAGNGLSCGSSPDGVAAINVSFCGPWGMTLDAAGNLYLSDFFNNRVRKVAANGIVSTVAGNGTAGYSGDNGPAASASINRPLGLAVDGAGNLFIADSANGRVRKVNPAGAITTIAGNGTVGYSGDGGPATSAMINPQGLALDAAGNLYIGDSGSGRVRVVKADGSISTFAGGGNATPSNVAATSASLGNPVGLFVDAAGNLYIGDDARQKVYKVSGGIITTIGGTGVQDFSGDGGPATAATFSNPDWVTADAAGNVYVSDLSNSRLRKIAAGSGTISTIAGNGNYRYAGDGGPAAAGVLSDPVGIARDSAGNLYIAEYTNNRVRKVSATDGTISTFAGNGVFRYADATAATSGSFTHPEGLAIDAQNNLYVVDYFGGAIRKITPGGAMTTFAGRGSGGDGGPAASAKLTGPSGVGTDSAGNVYIGDSNANRVRVVNSAGIISTLAGSGTAGFSGDGGQATAAALSLPIGVAVDAAGNVYIADSNNNRIRKIDKNGIITTFAGNGTAGFSGDGGLASAAELNQPHTVKFDSAGNMYISDTGNGRVRRVGTNGIITTVAGGGSGGDGGLAAKAGLSNVQDVLADPAGNLYISSNQSIRVVPAATPSFSAAISSPAFTATAGNPNAATQQIALTSATSGLAWTATVATQTGSGWLAISAAAGVIPANFTVSVNPANLAAGTYQGSITITVPQASPATATIPVTLTVAAATPANLQVQPAALSFTSATTSLTLNITNTGGSPLAWTATVNGSWLSISAAAGSVGAGATQVVQVSANAAGLAAGVYTGSVTVTSATTNQTSIVPVTLTVQAQTQTILVSQTGLLFTVAAGGTAAPQTIGVLNTGQGTMNWTAAAATLNGGSWLSVTPSSGSSVANSTQVPLIQINANASGLAAGEYSGAVTIASSGANNSPQSITVILNVLPAGSNPGVTVRPTGLIFTARTGASDPGSQTIQLGTASGNGAQFLSGLLTFGGQWVQTTPENGALSALNPISMVAQPSLGSLAAGIYRGSLTLAFSDGSPAQLVDLLFVVAGSGSATSPEGLRREDAAGCAPTQLLAVSRSLSGDFSSPVGYPASLEVQVADDCGNAVTGATVLASFSSSDPALALVSLGNGTYTGTWRPLNAGSQVVVTIRASQAGLTPVLIKLQGQVAGSLATPAVFSGGVVNGASFAKGDAVAPGSIVSVFGSNFAAAAAGATSVPLPTSLSGVSMTIGGLPAPLFYANGGQVNAQIPFELPANTRPQLLLTTPAALAVPETITLAANRPGIFTVNSSGTGQGAITNPQGQIVDSTAPVPAGSVVIAYCSGLGATNPAVASGAQPPAVEPLARTTAAVTATVGGLPAQVQFAGLAPQYVGLYQVNVQVPSGVATGNAVQVVLTQGGVSSNIVTIAVH